MIYNCYIVQIFKFLIFYIKENESPTPLWPFRPLISLSSESCLFKVLSARTSSTWTSLGTTSATTIKAKGSTDCSTCSTNLQIKKNCTNLNKCRSFDAYSDDKMQCLNLSTIIKKTNVDRDNIFSSWNCICTTPNALIN